MDEVRPRSEWRKSTFSVNGDCVEWRIDPTSVQVRNSRTPDLELSFTPSEWKAFLSGVRSGEADLPTE